MTAMKSYIGYMAAGKCVRAALVGVMAVFAMAGASAQKLKTSYFMEGSIPRYDMNAALTPMDGYVNLPFIGAVDVKVNNNYLSVRNLIYPTAGGGHTIFLNSSVDAQMFMKRMPAHPNIGVETNIGLVGFGNYNREHNYFWSFGWNFRAVGDVSLSRELFGTLKNFSNGYHSFDGMAIDASSYNEFAFGFAMPVGWENLVIGGRVKLLTGIANAEVSFDTAYIDVTSDYALAVLGGSVRAANGAGFKMSGFGSGTLKQWLDHMKGWSSRGLLDSWGAGIDFGAEAKFLDERLKVSIGVNDLGFIYWGGGRGAVQGRLDNYTVDFRGYNTSGGQDGKGAVELSKTDNVTFTETGSEGYSRRLVTTLNVGAEYNFFDNLLGLGLLSHTRFGKYHTQSELTAAATVRPCKWFTAALSHTMINNRAGNFGFAFNFHPRGINFFLGCDYIPTHYGKINGHVVPVSTKPFNIHFGLAFTPGGRSKPW